MDKKSNINTQLNILITGATSGIGEKLAEAYLTEGHHVYLCGRSQSKLDELMLKFEHLSGKTSSLCFDLANVKEKANEIDESLQGVELDLVILNAGICEYIDVDNKNFAAEVFDKVIHINLIGTAYCVKSFMPKLAHNAKLAVVSSSASYLPFSRASAYGSSKIALNYLIKSLAIDVNNKELNTQFYLIQPGFVKTPLTDRNDFSMPFLITSEKAADEIRKGLNKTSKSGLTELHFPKKLTIMLKVFSFLPFSVWKYISNNYLKHEH